MSAKSATRSLSFLTRSGSYSTRLSRRGHGFEFSSWEDDADLAVPLVQAGAESAPPLPKIDPNAPPSHRMVMEAQARAVEAKDDLAWAKNVARHAVTLICQGDAEGARWLCECVASMPQKMHPRTTPDIAVAWLRANVAEKLRFNNAPMSAHLAAALDVIERTTREAR